MIEFGPRLQCFTLDHPSVDEVCVYDATPEGVPSILFFSGKRCSATTIEEFASVMHDYGFCKGYGPITVGIIEDFLSVHAVEKVEKHRGQKTL